MTCNSRGNAFTFFVALTNFLFFPSLAYSHDVDGQAKQLSNPVPDLLSVPFQANFDYRGGCDVAGFSYTLLLHTICINSMVTHGTKLCGHLLRLRCGLT